MIFNSNIRWRSVVNIAIGVVILAALGYAVVQSLPRGDNRAAIGEPAPDFQLTDMEGHAQRLSDYRGRGVLINFWGSWCEPCVNEMPLLKEAYAQAGDGVEVLAVNVGQSRGTVKQFAEEQGLIFPLLLDVSGETAKTYRISGLPVSVLIDAEGVIAEVHTGEMKSVDEIKRMIDEVRPRRAAYAGQS